MNTEKFEYTAFAAMLLLLFMLSGLVVLLYKFQEFFAALDCLYC